MTDAYEAHMICQFGVMVSDDSGVENNELYASWFYFDGAQERLAFIQARLQEFWALEEQGVIELRGNRQYGSPAELFRVWFMYTSYGKMLLHMMRQLAD